jgi:transposase-like protein
MTAVIGGFAHIGRGKVPGQEQNQKLYPRLVGARLREAGVPTEMADRLRALERENRELRQANEILRKASTYFAMAECDRRSK